MKTIIFAVLVSFAFSTAHAGEYDQILAQDYQARKAAAGGQVLAQYAEYSAKVGRFLQNYIRKNGGDPAQVSCRTSSGYSCDGSLCTPFMRSSLSLLELGAPGHSFRACDFSLPGDRACKAGEEADCYRLNTMKERERCNKAHLYISCVNRQTREQTGEYINSL